MERLRRAAFHLFLVIFLGVVIPVALLLTLVALAKEFFADRRPAPAGAPLRM